MTHDFNTTALFTYTWMISGFLLMIFDLKFSQSIFLLLSGLGAVTSSVALILFPELAWSQQVFIFAGTTLFLTVLM